MRRHTHGAARLALLLTVTAILAVGCAGGTDDAGVRGRKDGDVTDVTNGSSRASFLIRADEICRVERAAEGKPTGVSSAEVETYFRKLVSARRARIAQIRTIALPEADSAALDDVLAKMTASADAFEAGIPANAKDPSATFDDPEIVRTGNDASAAARAFGFQVCEQDPASSGTGSTVPTTLDLSRYRPEDAARAYLLTFGRTSPPTEVQVACVATSIFAVPGLASLALKATATPDELSRVYGPLIDCIGADPLVDRHVAAIQGPDWSPSTIACVRAELMALSGPDRLAVLTGDRAAEDAFVARSTADCAG